MVRVNDQGQWSGSVVRVSGQVRVRARARVRARVKSRAEGAHCEGDVLGNVAHAAGGAQPGVDKQGVLVRVG